MAKSQAGSFICSPPVTFINVSELWIDRPAFFSNTAISMDALFLSMPVVTLLANPTGEYVTSACISIRTGLVPSIAAVTTVP